MITKDEKKEEHINSNKWCIPVSAEASLVKNNEAKEAPERRTWNNASLLWIPTDDTPLYYFQKVTIWIVSNPRPTLTQTNTHAHASNEMESCTGVWHRRPHFGLRSDRTGALWPRNWDKRREEVERRESEAKRQ